MRGPGKGKTNNPAGKPPGTKNQKTKAWERMAEKMENEHADHVNEYLDTLWKTDKDKFFEAYKSLLNYFKPKFQTTSGTVDITTTAQLQINVISDDVKKEIDKL